MPPKKCDPLSSPVAKNAKEKPPKKRVKKEKVEKPKLKTPTIIKIKIPKKSQNSMAYDDSEMPPKKKKKLEPSEIMKRKIELANEVALAQLVKPSVINTSVVQSPPVSHRKETSKKPKKPEAAKKPRVPGGPKGKPKKTKNQETLDCPENIFKGRNLATLIDCPENIFEEKKPIKKPKKIKPKTDGDVLKPRVSNKQTKKADSTSKDRTKQVKEKKNLVVDEVFEDTVSPVKKKRGRKGKITEEVTSTDVNESPSILARAKLEAANLKKDTEIDPETTSDVFKSPAPTDSRKTSVSECLSWTKDISSSSTTTCVSVGSNDFCRIDKKIPVVRLSHIDNQWRAMNPVQNDDNRSESESEKITRCTSSLSSSSSGRNSPRSVDLSSNSSHCSSATKDEICKYALDKLASQIQKFDPEFIDWIGHENVNVDPEIKLIQEKMFKLLKEENEAIQHCRNIKKIFRSENSEKVTESDNTLLERANMDIEDRSEDDEFTSSRSRFVMFDQNCETEDDPLKEPPVPGSSDGEDFSSNRVNFQSFDDPYQDDDDALSIFAESITGIESSRLNSSESMSVAASDYEEYVPEPLSKDFDQFKRPIYNPTKIGTAGTPMYSFKRIVCEKQNADSTYRETDQDFPLESEGVKPPDVGPNLFLVPPPIIPKKLTSVLDPNIKTVHCTRSITFKGVCFYNLISNCKRSDCHFPHEYIHETRVASTLARVSDEVLLMEYKVMRCWPMLRHKYGLLYIKDCIRRNLTGSLLEMTIDIILRTKPNSPIDEAFKVDVIELALMHLNSVDLRLYDRLLRYSCGNDGIFCDILMQTIANTQNFSRFKLVFLNLTSYISEIGRAFRVEAANLILERVCILRPDLPLANALVTIVENTHESIFANPKINTFEEQILSLDQMVYEKFVALKEGVNKTATFSSAQLVQEGDATLPHVDRENRYTSPDTTKLDNMNNQVQGPIIKRTIHIPRMPFPPPYRPHSPRSMKPGWRHNFSGRHRPLLRPPTPIRPLKRPMDHRHVAFGPPPRFPRRPGMDY